MDTIVGIIFIVCGVLGLIVLPYLFVRSDQRNASK